MTSIIKLPFLYLNFPILVSFLFFVNMRIFVYLVLSFKKFYSGYSWDGDHWATVIIFPDLPRTVLDYDC